MCRPRRVGRRLHQSVEHCLKVEGRAADDLEYVGGGGLLLQGFANVGALAQLIEQARFSMAMTACAGEF